MSRSLLARSLLAPSLLAPSLLAPAPLARPGAETRRAIVLGGSVAGLLAAAALAPHVAEVLVVERDELTESSGHDPRHPAGPDSMEPRPGTPQATHAHGLLAAGRLAMEELLPGLTDELLAAGAVSRGDIGRNGHWYLGGSLLSPCDVGADGVAVSRRLLERQIRHRVSRLPNVTLRTGAAAVGLAAGSGRCVSGVLVTPTSAAPDALAVADPEVLPADLVVDATGRPGRAARWFAAHGWPVPTVERVEVGVRYATTHVEIRPGDVDGRTVVVSAATPQVPRGGVAIQQEGDRWVVMLFGYTEDQPPLDADGFRAWARTVVAPELAELVSDRPLLEPPRAYRFPHCLRRRVERCDLPSGYLAIGDAICSFDPTFGQGMSVAARQAVALRAVAEHLGDRDRFGRVYHRRAASIAAAAWTLVVGADLQLPGTTGVRPPAHRPAAAWVRRVQRAARRDPAVARTLMRVTNLLEPPTALFATRLVARVLRTGAADRVPAPDGRSRTLLSAVHRL